MADSPEVRVRLSAEGVDEVVRALDKVRAASKKASDEAKTSSAGMRLMGEALSDLKTLIPALGIAGAVSGLASLTKSAVEGADAMAKLSKKTGISVETLSVLSTGAELADVGIEGLAKGLKKMSVSLYELETGGGAAAEGFRQIGLTSKDLQGLKLDQAFVKISDKVAKLPPGLLQTSAAMKIFGKNGADLIPLMQDMADGGFDELYKKLERTGRIMSTETAAQAEVLMDELKMLEKTTKGAALAFASGMMPSLLEVTRSMEDTATESKTMWKAIGEGVGGFLNVMVRGAQGWGAFIGALTTVDWKKLVTDMDGFKASWNNALDAMNESLNGGLNRAIADLPAKVKKIREEISKLSSGEQSEALGKLGAALGEKDPSRMVAAVDLVGKVVDSQVKAQKQVQEEAARLAAERAIKLSKDLSAIAQSASANRLADEMSKIRQDAQFNKELYDEQIIDLREYYKLRRDEIERAGAAEIQALRDNAAAIRREKLDPNDEGAALRRRQSLDTIENQIQVKQRDTQTQKNANTAEERRAVEDLAQRKLELEAQILEAQGLTFAASMTRLEAQAQAMKRQGFDPETIQSALDSQKQKALFQSLQRQGANALGALDTAKGGIDNQLASGSLFPFEAVEKYHDAIRAAIPDLLAYAEAQRAAAVTDEEIKAADDYKNQIDALAISANKDAKQLADFKASAEGAITSDLTNFFSKGIDEAENFGDAVRMMALSVVDSLRQIASQMLATYATQQMLKFFSSFGGGGGDAGNLKAATGGYISGPGTGTSDSIPARLSDGEFVVRAAVVKQPGVLSHLAALNRGTGSAHVQSRGSVPHFAEGGLVSAGEAIGGGMMVEANFGLDEGVIAKKMNAYLKSPDGQRIQIENLSSNRRRASSALGRG